MKKKVGGIISIVVLIPVLLFVAGIVAQFIININAWKAAGSDYRTSPGLPSLELDAIISALFTFPEGPIAIAAIVIGIALICVFGLRLGWNRGGMTDLDRNLTISSSGSYGTAGFMSEREARNCFDLTTPSKTKQDILGLTNSEKVITLPEKTRLNSNLAICGASGTGKSRSISRNLILQAARRGESIIVTDPKSELYESMSQYLRDQGYTVRVFNLIEMDHSDSWNCLGEVGGSELMAQTFSDIVLSNTSGDSKDAFWFNAELNLLKALVLYVSLEMPPEKRNLGTVYELLTKEDERSLNKIMSSIRREHVNKFTGEVMPPSPAFAPFAIFMQSNETVRTSVIIGLGSKLQVMQAKQVRNITSYNEIDLELPGKQKCAYFIRSRGVSVAVFFQNVGQMKNRYPDDQWQEILGACDSTVFLGCTDTLTAKYFSDRIGVASVEVESEMRELNTMHISNYTPQFRRTNSLGRRQLLTPDEVLRLLPDEELIFIRGQKVFRAHRFDYSKHPEYKKLRNSKAVQHEPDWRRSNRAFVMEHNDQPVISVDQAGEGQPKPTGASPPSASMDEEAPIGRSVNLNEILKGRKR